MDRAPVKVSPDRIAGMRVASWLAISLTLGGCATYHSRPLGTVRGADSVGQLSAPLADMPWLQAHRLDPRDGLDVIELSMLAVANSPALKRKRDELGLVRAQSFAAGLLPDPQLSLGEDFPQRSLPGLSTAFNLGITQDITALLTRSSRTAEARSHVEQVNLDLLWAEWQTVAQARQLFDQVTSLRAQQRRLRREADALAPVDRFVQMALQAGNLTYDTASAGLNAGADVRKRLGDRTLHLHQAESDLRLLLGLAASAPLDLVGAVDSAQPTAAQVKLALSDLSARRPDLLALKAGYGAQNAKLRGAILAQFPALTLGFNSARDTSAVYTRGFSIGISLPLFNRNRGNIAIERATRLQLKDAYDERVLTARSDVQRLQADLDTLDSQGATLRAHVRQLDAGLGAAEKAWREHLLDWPTYLAIRGNVLSADLDLLSFHQQRATAAIALQALLGNTDLPAVRKPAP